MTASQDIFIVGLNITKLDASLAARNGKDIVRVAHGVYFRTGVDAEKIFNEYGLRLANYFFKNVALTHSTAWYKRPLYGRVFIGGDYPYKKVIAPEAGDLCIVQSKIHPVLTDHRLYECLSIEDGFGPKQKFEMYCSTPELTLLHLMETPKKNMEKQLSVTEMKKLVAFLLDKHGGKASLLTVIEEIALLTDKQNEFVRLLKHFFLQKKISI